MAEHDGTDANRVVLGERSHENLLPLPSAGSMDAILDERRQLTGLGGYGSGLASPPCPRIATRSQPLTALDRTAAGGDTLSHH